MKALLVEDHRDLSALVADHLGKVGFVVDAVSRTADAIHAVDTNGYDVVVLDLGLPDGDGMDVLAHVRRGAHSAVPVLILTARDDLESRLAGLNGGADDYLVKPFDLPELEARLRAILRRPGARPAVLLSVGNLEFDIGTWEVKARGAVLTLARKEYALLEELMRASPRIVVKDKLEDRLYAFDEPVTLNAIEAIVSRLRKKIRHSDVRISTVRGIGYRLVEGETAADE